MTAVDQEHAYNLPGHEGERLAVRVEVLAREVVDGLPWRRVRTPDGRVYAGRKDGPWTEQVREPNGTWTAAEVG